jgi:hypothetical protein
MTASAAPFCFSPPTGFQDASARPDYGYGWRWRTLVSAGPHDLVEVLAQPGRTELAPLSDAAALRFVEQLRLRADALHVVSAAP